ncbi:multiple epidermal growth factor-like domains protein 6 [Crassostrea angulata]|uniref:multiple epidermal growth factor-like domains protein 6 n=1 Tax=Magallana angulata TaxID=2784310 RepID=UPI0022B0FE68|nr:multiple epidermal growth factor-like domains protein 6 [Crassostrea angulata]
MNYILVIFFLNLQCVYATICGGKNGTSCCIGYKWDHILKKCTPCEEGYTGTNCETVCVYPSYGLDCQLVCNCIASECDHANGCVRDLKDFSHQYTTNVLEETAQFELSTKEPFHVKANTVKAAGTPTTRIVNHQSTMTKIEPMTIGIIILAAVCFILAIVILYTYQMENSKVCIK